LRASFKTLPLQEIYLQRCRTTAKTIEHDGRGTPERVVFINMEFLYPSVSRSRDGMTALLIDLLNGERQGIASLSSSQPGEKQ
jgi:hypothetical protein